MPSELTAAERAAALADLLSESRFGAAQWVADTDSTNADLVQLVHDEITGRSDRAGAALHERVLFADFQRAGRGRRDRSWIAPPGSSLMMSVLVNAEYGGDALEPHVLVTALALGAAEACGRVGVDVGLKWPNDLVVGERKLAGILAEVPAVGFPWVVIGIGLNLHWPDGFPEEIAETATTIALERAVAPHESPVDQVAFAADVVAGFERRLASAPTAIMDEYRQRSATIGRQVRVERIDGTQVGTATAIRDDGCLELSTDEGTTVVSVGDVVHLRRNPA